MKVITYTSNDFDNKSLVTLNEIREEIMEVYMPLHRNYMSILSDEELVYFELKDLLTWLDIAIKREKDKPKAEAYSKSLSEMLQATTDTLQAMRVYNTEGEDHD